MGKVAKWLAQLAPKQGPCEPGQDKQFPDIFCYISFKILLLRSVIPNNYKKNKAKFLKVYQNLVNFPIISGLFP